MNDFMRLRELAKENREKAFGEARREYESSLLAIAALELKLLGKPPSKHSTTTTAVLYVVPRDRGFTVADVLVSLRALNPRRIWKAETVRQVLCRLKLRGLLNQIRRPSGAAGSVYAMADSPLIERTELFGKSLAESVQHVLTRPMTWNEIAKAILDAGYQTTMPLSKLYRYVRKVLNNGKFKESGGKWSAG